VRRFARRHLFRVRGWWVFSLLLWPGLATASNRFAFHAAIARSEQLILVCAENWTDDHGTLALFERTTGGGWREVADEVPVTLGRNGLAWGIGLYGQRPSKREGDLRSPAGVFELEKIYGRDEVSPNDRFPYQQRDDAMEGIDDPRSRFYNRLVDVRRVGLRDWTHSEKVHADDPMFRWCVEVKHNWEQRPGYGSCIYLHIWHAPGHPTSGCTAMDSSALERIVRWLDASKHPVLVQMPRAALERLHLELPDPKQFPEARISSSALRAR
jgi:L,D-peptidoglycan transpeptidase YkuD (ErfK/YbiS/YcfS/YnhG family)